MIRIGDAQMHVTLETQHIGPGDLAAVRRRDLLPDDEQRFGLAGLRAEHHRLLDALDLARAHLRALPAELKQAEQDRLAAISRGEKPAGQLDGDALRRKRREAVLGVEAALVRFGDQLVGELREQRAAEWQAELSAQRDQAQALAVAARQAAEAAEADALDAAGALAWLEALAVRHVAHPNGIHGKIVPFGQAVEETHAAAKAKSKPVTLDDVRAGQLAGMGAQLVGGG